MEGEGGPFRRVPLLPPNLPHPPRTFLSRVLYTVPLFFSCCGARRGAGYGAEQNPAEESFWWIRAVQEDKERAAVAFRWWGVTALFASLSIVGVENCFCTFFQTVDVENFSRYTRTPVFSMSVSSPAFMSSESKESAFSALFESTDSEEVPSAEPPTVLSASAEPDFPPLTEGRKALPFKPLPTSASNRSTRPSPCPDPFL